MENSRLNHEALNAIQSDFMLPGGVRAYSDFQQYYVREAAKAYMGLESHFHDGNKSKSKVLEKVVPILKNFNLLIDEDPSYDLFKKFTNLISKYGEDMLMHDVYFRDALEKLKEVDFLLDKVSENQETTRNKTLGIDAQEEIRKIIEESGLTKEEVFEQLKD